MRSFLRVFIAVLGLSVWGTACAESSTTAGNSVAAVAPGEFGAPKASPSGLFQVSLAWSADLMAGTLDNNAVVRFTGADGQTLAAELSSFRLFMPSMGHGSIKIKDMVLAKDAAQAGVWNVSKIYFSMGGAKNEWVVDITASVNGVSETVRVDIPYEVGE